MGRTGMQTQLARLWGCSPAAVRDCTYEEIEAMWAVLRKEAERNG